MTTSGPSPAADLNAFVARVVTQGRDLYRDFAWRRTHDPYAILVSEVMLQQTQVSRVEPRYDEWLADYPTLETLAAAPLEVVLESWQGLGYNRRAIALKRAAEQVVADCAAAGVPQAALPADEVALRALPGIGPATAAGVLAFAFEQPSTYLETNVRTVFLHELFADRDGVTDREIVPLVEAAVLKAAAQGVSARQWYYALLDFGAHLKRELPNPSRRSAHHTRQSKFEGSRRQKRAWLLRAVMAGPGDSAEELARALSDAERTAGRDSVPAEEVAGILAALGAEGFIAERGGGWFVA
jgi:A/G-specific adenine glycosylase